MFKIKNISNEIINFEKFKRININSSLNEILNNFEIKNILNTNEQKCIQITLQFKEKNNIVGYAKLFTFENLNNCNCEWIVDCSNENIICEIMNYYPECF